MREPSRLRKAEEIIELAMMFQNSFRGICIDDIKEHFECSRRSAERMKALLFELFPDKVEEVPTIDKKKRWRFVKGTMNALISFTADDFANLEYLKGLSTDENKQKQLDELVAECSFENHPYCDWGCKSEIVTKERAEEIIQKFIDTNGEVFEEV